MKTTRETLIDAATTLLDGGGPETVTLREVGRIAGVSHNAPYRHFADKSALLAAVAARELAIIKDRYLEAAAGTTTLQAVLQDYVRRALQHPERFKLIYSDSIQNDEHVDRLSSEVRSTLADAVATAQSRGELPERDRETIGWLLRACVYGATVRALGTAPRNTSGSVQPEALIAELFYHLKK